MLLKKIFNRKGEAYIDLIISFICLMLVLAVAIIMFRMFAVRNDLNYAAKQLIQTATTNGQFGTGTSGAVHGNESFVKHRERLETELGVGLNCAFDGTIFYNGTSTGTTSAASADYKVQLGEIMELTVTTATPITIGSGVLRVTLNLSAKASGSSERYWK